MYNLMLQDTSGKGATNATVLNIKGRDPITGKVVNR